jgi:chemotaxis protein MotB
MARKSRHGHGGHDNDERWLLTYADMITLLMALFMVLFSISSVNISKYRTLQQSLRAAFSGSLLPGGHALEQSGSTSSATIPSSSFLVQTIVPATPTLGTPKGSTAAQKVAQAAQVEQSHFISLKARLEAYAKAHGFASQVRVTINPQGLAVELLTDRVLFSSGSAELNPAGLPLLGEIADLLNQAPNPINVTGYTDSVPTNTPQFPSNLWLSSGRADTVEGYLTSRSVTATRIYALGRGALNPVASNATDAGRGLNRRVVIELVRI